MPDGSISGSWFARVDRYASVHAVRSQAIITRNGKDKSNSCGIASIIMVNFKMKKHLVVAGVAAGAAVSSVPILGGFVGGQLASAFIDNAVKTEPEVYRIYTSVTGSAYDGSAYSDALKFPSVLLQLGLGDWECVFVGEGGFYAAAKAATDSGTPVIGHVVWNSGGAHFVVIDEVHSTFGGKLCVCDPWDGELRLVSATSGSPVNYDPSGHVWSFSAGGNRHETSTKPNPSMT